MEGKGTTCSFACGYLVCPQPFVENAVFFLTEWAWLPYQESFGYDCEDLFLGSLFYSIVLSVFIHIPHCFDYNSIVISLKSESVRHLTLYIFKIVLAIEALRFTIMAQL